MKPEEKIELHIPSILGYEKVVMEACASLAKKMGFSEARIEDLKTAVSEACLNAIEHGNKLDASTQVAIYLSVEGSKLEVAVHDQGEGTSQSAAKPNIEDKLEGKDSPRGWGNFLIQALMDEVEVESTPMGGNVVRMVIHVER